MDGTLIRWKAAITAAVCAFLQVFGWRGVLMFAWVVAMALDYISGTMAAIRTSTWSSTAARDGLYHKGGMILVVAISGLTDLVAAVACSNMDIGIKWPWLVMPLVLAWYVFTEAGSVLENAAKMGANVPQWTIRLFKASILAVEKAGEKNITEKETEK